MDLLHVETETLELQINPHAFEIEVIKKLIRRDKGMEGDASGRLKKRAKKELSYLYLMHNHKSKYVENFPDEEDRYNQVVKDLGLQKDWKPDKYLKAAEEWYKEFIEGHAIVKLYKSGLQGLSHLKNYLDTVDLTERDKQNKPVVSMKEYRETLADLNRLAGRVEELEKRVADRQSSESKNYAGVEDTEFNT